MSKSNPKSIIDVSHTCTFMITTLIMLNMHNRSAVYTMTNYVTLSCLYISHYINNSLGDALNKLSVYTKAPCALLCNIINSFMLVLWCITKINALVLCLSMMYTTRLNVLKLNILTMICYVNELLSMFCHCIMNVMYDRLNENHQCEKQFVTRLVKFWNFPLQKLTTKNATFFENFLTERCKELLSTLVPKIKRFNEILNNLPVMKQNALCARKTTWQCLLFKIIRALSRSDLVMDIKPFKCVSPYFRYTQINTKIFLLLGINCFFNAKYIRLLHRNAEILNNEMKTVFGKGLRFLLHRINTQNICFICERLYMNVKAFIMIIIYMYPNG